MALMADAGGFEPTGPCGQLHFECSSLQPLRYASVYKYSLLGTNHMISSQSRYDHFDTAPYLSQHQHLRKRGELMGRTSKNIKLRIPEKPRKIKGFRTGSYRVATTISSLVRTWHFRVCCVRWRQFWKRRKSLCCNGFRTHRPVLTSSISEKTKVQIEMRNAPKRSIFLRAGKKIRKKKTLVRYGFADSHPD